MWDRATKIKVLVAILAAVVLIVGLAILLLSRVEGVRGTARQVMRVAVEAARFDPEKARKELQAELDKIKAAGEPTSLQEIIPPEVPDEENAAVVYQQAFEELSLSERDKDALWNLLSSMAQPPRSETPSMEAVEQIVAKNVGAIALLEKAAQRPKCRFPVDWEAGAELTSPHLSRMRSCARLLAAKAVVEARRGEVVEALHTVEVGLAMCEALRQEPLMLSQVVRYAIVSMLVDSLRAVVEEDTPPTDACGELFAYLRGMEFMDSLVDAFLTARAMGIWIFDHARDDPQYVEDIMDIGDTGLADVIAGPAGETILNIDEATYLQLMSEYIVAARNAYQDTPARIGEADVALWERVRPACILTVSLVPVYARSTAQRDRAIARVGLAQVVLALKAYKNEKGEYAQSLAQLPEVIEWGELPEDPFSGQDFIYRREGQGFLVYSIGADLEDDGGKAEEDWEEGDIVWRCSK